MAAYGSDLRMVLVGKTGSGKSAAGNLILGRKEFSVSMSSKSVTRKCEKHETTVGGRKISVVDTPGLFDTEITVDKLKAEIERCVELSVPGPHVFLLVIRLDVRFTEEERNTVKWIQENFGEEALKHTIVLFTHADALKTVQIEQYIGDDKHLKQLVAECGYHLFNNEDMENRSQVRELLKKINVLSSTYYTNKMYQAVQKRLEEEKEKKRKEEEEKRKQWEEKIRADERKKFKEKVHKQKQQNQEEEKKKRNKKIALGAGAGLAVGGAASGAAVAAAVVAEIGLVAVAASVALVALPAIGAVIGWAAYKKSKNKNGYERLSNSQSDISETETQESQN